MGEEQEVREESSQYVMFELAGEVYGIDLGIVQEVIRLSEITRVPRAADFIEGVINLRGFFIPVVDMKKRFSLGVVEPTKSSRIMILEIGEQIVGILVDKVSEVISLDEENIEPASPIIHGSAMTEYLRGFTEVDEELVKILDFEKVFTNHELQGIDEIDVESESETEALGDNN